MNYQPLGLIISLSRHIHDAHTSMKEGCWEKKRFKGVDLGGKTLGLWE